MAVDSLEGNVPKNGKASPELVEVAHRGRSEEKRSDSVTRRIEAYAIANPTIDLKSGILFFASYPKL